MDNKQIRKENIQRKVIASILLVGIIPGIIVVILTYLTGINALKNSIGINLQEIAKETADKIQIITDREIQDAQSLALSPYIKAAVLKDGRFSQNSVNSYLKAYLKQRQMEYGSILITDAKGVVIASTNLVADYNQREAKWWNIAYKHGKVFISDIEYDEKAQTYFLTIAVPVLDNKNIIGVLKIIHDVNDIFKIITSIKIGETGHANLVTSDGILIVCPVFPPKSHRINNQLMQQISFDKPGWGIAADDAHGGKDSIIGFAPVASTLKIGQDNFGGKKWHIFIRQHPDETYAPMNALLWKASFLGIALVAVLSMLGFYAGRRIIKPIKTLIDGVELLGRGRLEHRISIKTKDEIEQLAETFNQMAGNLEKSNKETERYLSQLKESEERYKTLFDHSEDSMLMMDLEGRIVAVNKREEDVIGYKKDTLLGKEFAMVLCDEDRNAFADFFRRTLSGEKPSTIEVKVLSNDRGLLIMELDLTGIKSGNEIVFVQIHLRDITTRKILEREIKLERDKLETIIESMGDGLDIVDKDFRIQYMNEKFLKLYGKDAVGKSCYKVYTGRDKPCNECPVVKGIEKIGVLEVNAPQGQTFLITHSPFKNLDGTTSILEIFKDITERKKMERTIKESEERYKTLFDHSEDSMLMMDLDGRIVAVNKREEDVIGYTKDEFIGKEFSMFLSNEGRGAFNSLFKRAVSGEKPPTTEMKILSKSHSSLTMELDLTGIRSGERIAFVQIHLRDITKRKELEQQLLRSERLAAIGHFSSTLVHDLRNPIIGIKKRLEGLKGAIKTTPPKSVNMILSDVISGGELLIGMVNDVLDIYQNSYEEIPLIISPFPVIDAMKEAVKLLQVEAEGRKVKIILHNKNKSIQVQGDKRRLQRVFINLLDNALKYSPANGKIDIFFEPVSENGTDWLLLKIEDDGPGILPTELNRIFEPFQKKTEKRDGKTGTGLGLYFCKVVVELHHGRIWAENKKGKGAVFFIKIPIGEK